MIWFLAIAAVGLAIMHSRETKALAPPTTPQPSQALKNLKFLQSLDFDKGIVILKRGTDGQLSLLSWSADRNTAEKNIDQNPLKPGEEYYTYEVPEMNWVATRKWP